MGVGPQFVRRLFEPVVDKTLASELEEEHGVPISYAAIWRLVRRLEHSQLPETFVRVEVPPGSEAQVDFGCAGRHIDPASGLIRKCWVFVLVLSFSRLLKGGLIRVVVGQILHGRYSMIRWVSI